MTTSERNSPKRRPREHVKHFLKEIFGFIAFRIPVDYFPILSGR